MSLVLGRPASARLDRWLLECACCLFVLATAMSPPVWAGSSCTESGRLAAAQKRYPDTHYLVAPGVSEKSFEEAVQRARTEMSNQISAKLEQKVTHIRTEQLGTNLSRYVEQTQTHLETYTESSVVGKAERKGQYDCQEGENYSVIMIMSKVVALAWLEIQFDYHYAKSKSSAEDKNSSTDADKVFEDLLFLSRQIESISAQNVPHVMRALELQRKRLPPSGAEKRSVLLTLSLGNIGQPDQALRESLPECLRNDGWTVYEIDPESPVVRLHVELINTGRLASSNGIQSPCVALTATQQEKSATRATWCGDLSVSADTIALCHASLKLLDPSFSEETASKLLKLQESWNDYMKDAKKSFANYERAQIERPRRRVRAGAATVGTLGVVAVLAGAAVPSWTAARYSSLGAGEDPQTYTRAYEKAAFWARHQEKILVAGGLLSGLSVGGIALTFTWPFQ